MGNIAILAEGIGVKLDVHILHRSGQGQILAYFVHVHHSSLLNEHIVPIGLIDWQLEDIAYIKKARNPSTWSSWRSTTRIPSKTASLS
eukprot:5580258-Karenia_brevis.AAC.1